MEKGDVIYYLSEYNWEKGEILSIGPKNIKINTPILKWDCTMMDYIVRKPKEKCALPDEKVAVIWEQHRGTNSRGGYRVEKELYPEHRVRADLVHYQEVGKKPLGRLTETSHGVLKV